MIDGMKFYVIPLKKNGPAVGGYKGIVAEVIVNIDGNAVKAYAGKNAFGFLLDGSGSLIPYGSAAFKYYLANAGSGVLSNALLMNVEPNACKRGSLIADNLACTGVIADKGWKANY